MLGPGRLTWHDVPVLAPAVQLLVDLLEPSPNVYFCAKDTGGRYLAVSEMFVRRMGYRRRDLIGMSVDDFCPPDLARLYSAEDRALLLTARTRRNRLERVSSLEGRDWFLTTRHLHSEKGFDDVIIAISTPVDLGERSDRLGEGLRRAIELAEQPDRGALRVTDLAAEAELTTDQLDRVMQRVLGASPKQLLMSIRADRAASLLIGTDDSLASIARSCHYYDQSQFTRLFKDAYGLTPNQFRATAGDPMVLAGEDKPSTPTLHDHA